MASSTDKMDSEKHSRKEEALAKLNEGVSFNKVAEEFSEDKAKQGTLFLPRRAVLCSGLLTCDL